MSSKYSHLLSPIKIGNTVFRNRLVASLMKPHFYQGNEPYPTEAMIAHYANKAKNGAALVTCRGASPVTVVATKYPGYTRHRVVPTGGGPPSMPDVDSRESYFSQMSEAIHFYGAKASMGVVADLSPEYDVVAGTESHDGNPPVARKEVPADMLEEIAEGIAMQAALMKELGFDMVFLPMPYRSTLLARFLSPLTNKRTDKFGGSLENQARFPIMVADYIKRKCGKDFLIEASISGSENYPGGLTIEDTIQYAGMFAGHFDMLQIRAGDVDPSHPTGFNTERTPFLNHAEAIKKSGAGVAVVTIGGYQDLDICEGVIASGKADFIAMARSWVSNPEYGRLAYEGRNEDVVPCIRCNKCHISSFADPWVSVCSVNPAWEFEYKIEKMIKPTTDKKKVAVIGGGPAGMEAALVSAGRGHQVTLFEKSGELGGMLKTADKVSFKWPVKDFKNYLVRQINKSGVHIHLNVEATPELISQGDYDAVLVAAGAEPVVPQIPGINGKNVYFASDVYGKEESLAENVVVIGGGEVGVETGMHLAETGHQVTVLEMLDMLARESTPVHFYSMFQAAWEKLKNFHYILNAKCNGTGQGYVTYIDAAGIERTLKAGSVVVSTGMRAKNDLAMKFYGSGSLFYIIGDCDKAGNIQKAMRSAFGIASML